MKWSRGTERALLKEGGRKGNPRKEHAVIDNVNGALVRRRKQQVVDGTIGRSLERPAYWGDDLVVHTKIRERARESPHTEGHDRDTRITKC